MVATVVAWFFGPGPFWEWRRTEVESTRLDIEKAKASLEIRAKMNELLSDILELQKDTESRQKHTDELESKISTMAELDKKTVTLEELLVSSLAMARCKGQEPI